MSSRPPAARKLRSGGACQMVDNIFQSERYQKLLPPDIFNRISAISSVNCDKISELVFEPGSSQPRNLRDMRTVNEGFMEPLPEEFNPQES